MSARFENLVDVYDHAIKQFAARELFGTKKNGAWIWTTYADFGAQVEKARGALASLGVGRGDKIAVIADNRVEWAVIAYACFGLGAAMVPMYEAQHDKDWEFIIADCDAKLVVVANKTILEKVRKFFKGNTVCLEDAAALDSNKSVAAIKPQPSDTACLIYTSGTTGNPKGVILSHGNIASNVNAVHDVFPMTEDDRSLSFLPWAHSFGQTCELHCLFSRGASMALCESTQKILENLAEVKPTLLFSVPRIFNKLYQAVQKQISEKPAFVQNLVKAALRCTAKEREHQRLSLSEHATLALCDKLVFSKVRERFGGRLKYAFSGGAAISRDVAEFIDSLGITVYEGYGLTETSPISTANWPGERRIGSVGRPIPGVSIEIDPNVGHGTPGRVEGEIIIHGPNVMQGYFKRDEENAQVFTKNRGFRTGDQGFVDASGYLYITGRIKEQYKLENGKYVVPSPLEEKLKLSPYILNAFVYGDNKPYNVALVCANTDALKKFAEQQGLGAQSGDALLENPRVRELFKKELEKYMAEFKGFEEIKEFAIIGEDFTTDNGMLTPSLKVKRRKVMEKYGKIVDGLYAKKKEKSSQAASQAN
ncbi:MAG TPA: long-chain fatty acid--CoA ligase [Polyangiaceae bacterium]|jgi:long-chain acyl-CoA synthetase